MESQISLKSVNMARDIIYTISEYLANENKEDLNDIIKSFNNDYTFYSDLIQNITILMDDCRNNDYDDYPIDNMLEFLVYHTQNRMINNHFEVNLTDKLIMALDILIEKYL